MAAPPPDGMYLTDETLRREGYRTHPLLRRRPVHRLAQGARRSGHRPSRVRTHISDDDSLFRTPPEPLPSAPFRPTLTRVVPLFLPSPTVAQPRDERERLGLLHRQLLLDTKPDSTLDALVEMCAAQFDVPVCLVSLVDGARQWFKANHGLPAAQTSRRESFCAWLLLPKDPKVLLVRDASADPRFAD